MLNTMSTSCSRIAARKSRRRLSVSSHRPKRENGFQRLRRRWSSSATTGRLSENSFSGSITILCRREATAFLSRAAESRIAFAGDLENESPTLVNVLHLISSGGYYGAEN